MLRPQTTDMMLRVRSTVPKLLIYSSHNKLKNDNVNLHAESNRKVLIKTVATPKFCRTLYEDLLLVPEIPSLDAELFPAPAELALCIIHGLPTT